MNIFIEATLTPERHGFKRFFFQPFFRIFFKVELHNLAVFVRCFSTKRGGELLFVKKTHDKMLQKSLSHFLGVFIEDYGDKNTNFYLRLHIHISVMFANIFQHFFLSRIARFCNFCQAFFKAKRCGVKKSQRAAV